MNNMTSSFSIQSKSSLTTYSFAVTMIHRFDSQQLCVLHCSNKYLDIIDLICLLTAVQKLQLQLCSSLVASGGCSLRHSLQKTFGLSWRSAPASGVPGAKSLASRLKVRLLLAMVEPGRRDGRRNQAASSLSAEDGEELQTPCSWKQKEG